jgi:hypothetical protein
MPQIVLEGVRVASTRKRILLLLFGVCISFSSCTVRK